MLKNTYLASTRMGKSRIFYCDSCIGRVRKASTMKTILLHSTPYRAKVRLISEPLIRNLSIRR